MTFVWPDYVQVAQDLLNINKPSASGEAIVRASVSRAYYAVHCVAHHEIVVKRGVQLPNIEGGVHERLIQAFFTINDAAWKEAGTEFQALKRLRVDADYSLPLPGEWGSDERSLRNKAALVIMRARLLLQSIPALPSPAS